VAIKAEAATGSDETSTNNFLTGNNQLVAPINWQ